MIKASLMQTTGIGRNPGDCAHKFQPGGHKKGKRPGTGNLAGVLEPMDRLAHVPAERDCLPRLIEMKFAAPAFLASRNRGRRRVATTSTCAGAELGDAIQTLSTQSTSSKSSTNQADLRIHEIGKPAHIDMLEARADKNCLFMYQFPSS